MPPGGADCHRGARFATGGPNKLTEYNAAAAEATVACAGGLGLQRTDTPGCDEGFRPLRAGSPGMQHLNVANCQQGAISTMADRRLSVRTLLAG